MTFDRKPDGRHRRAKLTADQACQVVWDKHVCGGTNQDIALKHGISESAVREILAGRTWRNATLELRRELIWLGTERDRQ